MIVVPTAYLERARYEIWQFESENETTRPEKPQLAPVYQDSAWGVAGYIAVISLVAVFAGEAMFSRDWFAAGRVDGELIRAGEWWRTVTALTLHSGLPHFAGNVVFGAIFGVMAGRVLGPGVTWLAAVLSASTANLVNTLLLDPSHRAIGASTAVFAVLGIVSGLSWRARFFRQDRWAYRLGPIVGGLALLAFTGGGSPGSNTDIGAHLAGFACGFLSGSLLTLVYQYVPDQRVQKAAGGVAIGIVALAWILAL